MDKLAFLANLLSTIFMCGLIWMVQVVHYPLFAKVGDALFREYHADHNYLITLIVLPAMFIELGTAAYFVIDRPVNVSAPEVWIGLGLVIIAWAATFFLSVPAHNQLASGFKLDAYNALVQTNWVRTIAWSIRSVLVVWQVYKLF